MTNHQRTWQMWLESLSALRSCPSETIVSVAQGLAAAAPQGPAGFKCVDACLCDSASARNAAMLYAELLSRIARPINTSEEDLRRLRDAIELDMLRADASEFPSRELAEINVVVSSRNERVILARSRFPSTWAMVSAWL